MSYRIAFELVSYLLLCSGLLAAVASGGVDPFAAALYVCLLAVSWRFRLPPISNWKQSFMVLGFLLIFLADVAILGDFIRATIRLLLLLGLYKLLCRRLPSDFLLVYLVSFALLLIASTYTISVVFLGALVIYLFLAILAFILFESQPAYQENPRSDFPLLGYLSLSAVMTGLIVLLSVPIFLAIPRFSMGFLSPHFSHDSSVTGFSTEVRLGELGRILHNSDVVFRVKLDRPAEEVPEEIMWRGVALDHYDGRVWSNTRKASMAEVHQDHSGRFVTNRQRRSNESLIVQSFSVEPFAQVILGAPEVVQISGLTLEGARLFQDEQGTLFFQSRHSEPFRYFVHSDWTPRGRRLSAVSDEAAPAEILQTYLQLSGIDPRIRSLAEQASAGQSSGLGKALALERFLKDGFEYSLENTPSRAADPLADFLLDSREGHCEYFATAHAVMLRTLGIPSRLVNGFRRGEYNTWGDWFVVRQSDAHSWVEAYFPGAGWVEFDPTPPGAVGRAAGVGRWIRQTLDSLDVFWTEVVTFDSFKQIGFFRSVGSALGQGWRKVSRWEGPGVLEGLRAETALQWLQRHWYAPAGLLAAAFLAAGLALFRVRVRLWMRRTFPAADQQQAASEYYLEMLRVLESAGLRKKAQETPAEFSLRAQAGLNSILPARITELYYQNRFGQRSLTAEQLTEIYSAIRQLSQRRAV
jgi:protein-glutamine gamma-glutamyltransferase